MIVLIYSSSTQSQPVPNKAAGWTTASSSREIDSYDSCQTTFSRYVDWTHYLTWCVDAAGRCDPSDGGKRAVNAAPPRLLVSRLPPRADHKRRQQHRSYSCDRSRDANHYHGLRGVLLRLGLRLLLRTNERDCPGDNAVRFLEFALSLWLGGRGAGGGSPALAQAQRCGRESRW